MATLSSVMVKDLLANRPAAGIDGRLFFATDTHQIYRDNGTGWDLVLAAASPAATLSAIPSAPGNFSLAHGLSAAPSRISILMTSAGGIWQQAAPDGTNIYLAASEGSVVTATIFVFV